MARQSGFPPSVGGLLHHAVLSIPLLLAPALAGAVDLDAAPAAPAIYAEEIASSATAPTTLFNVGGVLDLSTPLAYSFAQGEVRHARIACPQHVRFVAGATVLPSDATSTAIGAISGLGSPVITFSVSALTSGLTASDRLTVTGDRQITSPQDADCVFALYDTPSQALAGGADGRIVEIAGAYLDFAPSIALRVDATNTATADVDGVDGPFSRFLVSLPTNDATLGQVGSFSYGEVQDVFGAPQPLLPNGVPVTLIDLMDADTALVVSGDFEAASRVFLSTSPSCATVDFPADSASATGARFTVSALPTTGVHVCYGAGNGEIQPSDFSVSLEPVAASPALQARPISPKALGGVVRNGTELIAPLVQTGVGQLARIVLTNTGTEKRQFSIRILSSQGGTPSEADSTYVGLTSSDGAIPAQESLVLNVADVFPNVRFQGPARSAIRVIVSGPNTQIQGLYQILEPSRGALSNHVMVRPGSN